VLVHDGKLVSIMRYYAPDRVETGVQGCGGRALVINTESKVGLNRSLGKCVTSGLSAFTAISQPVLAFLKLKLLIFKLCLITHLIYYLKKYCYYLFYC
jgi:hypothetical protein